MIRRALIINKYYSKNNECKMDRIIQKQNSLISKRETYIKSKKYYSRDEGRGNYEEKSDS